MTDEEIFPPYVLQFIQDTSKLLDSLPRIEPPPASVIETAMALHPIIATVRDAMDQATPLSRAQVDEAIAQARLLPGLANVGTAPTGWPLVPTAAELAETDKTLRTRVLPETSEEELQKAVSEIPSDPRKLELAAFLADMIERATGVPGSAPWVEFVLAYWIAMKLNPNVVGALALAFAVLAVMKGD
jgi:hypothetical protein